MSELSYRKPVLLSLQEAEAALRSAEETRLVDALLAASLQHSTHRAWLEQHIERLAQHGSPRVRRACAVALGHVARVHGKVDFALAERVLQRLAADPDTRGPADDAQDDIDCFASSGW